VSGQLHTPAALPPGETAHGTHWIGGWVGPRAGLDDVEKKKFLTLPRLKFQPLGRPAHSHSLYRLRCPGSFLLSSQPPPNLICRTIPCRLFTIDYSIYLRLSFVPPTSMVKIEIEAPTFSDIQLTDGCKAVSPMSRPLFTTRKFPGTHFC
jgi:hypothetical protein